MDQTWEVAPLHILISDRCFIGEAISIEEQTHLTQPACLKMADLNGIQVGCRKLENR